MKFKLLAFIAAFLFLTINAHAQIPDLSIVNSGQSSSIRGMSIPNDHVIWVSGSNGNVARSTDEGKTWNWTVVKGYEKTDFRDIHAFDSSNAIIMGIGNPAYILKTKDGGQNWKVVYTKEMTGMFLDAMDFSNRKKGICIGDPLVLNKDGKKHFFVIRTNDGGDTWQEEPDNEMPVASEGEAIFSASGTNIILLDNKSYDYAFISGGLASNIYIVGHKNRMNKAFPLPLNQNNESAGAFSMATDDNKRFVCVGGDYKKPDARNNNFTWTNNNGKAWQTSTGSAPHGYRSCVRIIAGNKMVACGSGGVDLCTNPDEWINISKEGFNVCMVSPNKKLIFLGGGNGKIGMIRN